MEQACEPVFVAARRRYWAIPYSQVFLVADVETTRPWLPCLAKSARHGAPSAVPHSRLHSGMRSRFGRGFFFGGRILLTWNFGSGMIDV